MKILKLVPLSCPGNRFRGFQPSMLISSEPHTLPLAVLRFIERHAKENRMERTNGSRSHIITISSSLPLASHLPELAQRTHNTGPVCMVRVHRDLGGRFECSETLFRMGFVLHILIFASRPPVAMREPSGCTWTEKMDKRLGAWSLFPEESL